MTMYSRFRPAFDPTRRPEQSYRQPVYVPVNYSGIALGAPPNGVSPATDGTRLAPDDLPRNEVMQNNLPQNNLPHEAPAHAETGETEAEPSLPVVREASEAPKSSGAPSLLSGLFNSRHFPFGHGIGYEELLLLGLILFLMREGGEGKGDDDLSMTLLLLGALLFCG